MIVHHYQGLFPRGDISKKDSTPPRSSQIFGVYSPYATGISPKARQSPNIWPPSSIPTAPGANRPKPHCNVTAERLHFTKRDPFPGISASQRVSSHPETFLFCKSEAHHPPLPPPDPLHPGVQPVSLGYRQCIEKNQD